MKEKASARSGRNDSWVGGANSVSGRARLCRPGKSRFIANRRFRRVGGFVEDNADGVCAPVGGERRYNWRVTVGITPVVPSGGVFYGKFGKSS